jgi:serine/threonine protein kinase
MTRWFNTSLWKRKRHYIGGRYQLLYEIGQGASGTVHLALDIKTNQHYAIKELNKSRLQRQLKSELLWGPRSNAAKKRKLNQESLTIQEIEILKQVPQHKNIIQFITALEDPFYEDSIFIVTEIAKKGVVMDIVPHSVSKPYSDDQCRNIFKQLVNAVDHLHKHDIVHRDIKPQNLLMSNNNIVKLIDFGNATKVTDMPRKTSSSVGSPAFMAPELLKKGIQADSKCADLWSMGITLYCLAYGHLPFETSGILDLYNDIQHKPVVHSEHTDPALRDLIDRLLEKNPKDRISIIDLKIHPWMNKS